MAGTAVLALRSAASSLQQLMYNVNQCYEDGLYFSDYMSFCEDAQARIPPPRPADAPPDAYVPSPSAMSSRSVVAAAVSSATFAGPSVGQSSEKAFAPNRTTASQRTLARICDWPKLVSPGPRTC